MSIIGVHLIFALPDSVETSLIQAMDSETLQLYMRKHPDSLREPSCLGNVLKAQLRLEVLCCRVWGALTHA